MNASRILYGLLISLSLSYAGFAQGFKYLEVTVEDPDGKPLPGAEVQIAIDGMRFPMYADDKGVVSFNVPDGNSRLQIGVQMDGYLAQSAGWEKGEEIPETFTIPMKKGVPIGGIVHDEDGKPIEDVLVEGIMVTNGSTRLPGGGKLWPYFYGELARTDADGKWKIGSAPDEKIELQLKFSHPDYVSDQGYGFRGGTWEELRSLEKVVVMEKGIVLEGTVRDPLGRPISGAKVGLGSDYVQDELISTTDAEGKYRINNAEAGLNMVTVFAPNHAPQMKQVELAKDMEPVDFDLEEGHTIKFRVTDPDGKPIAGAGIAADTWQNSRALMSLATRGSTDEDGNWQWDHAPEDQIQFDLFCQGHMSVRGKWFAARTEPHEVVMPWPVIVSGNVVDAATKKPLENFQVIQGTRFAGNDRVYWERYNITAGRNGKYEITFDEPREACVLRVEAAGYRPGVSRDIAMDEGKVEIDFAMEEGTGPTGIVRLPNGGPAANVEIAMCTAGNNQIYINNGENQSQSETPTVRTDSEGKFELPFPDADFAAVALSDQGWAQYEGTPDDTSFELKLQPWGKVEGQALRGSEPLVEERIQFYQNAVYNQNQPYVYWSYYTTTDSEGKFSFNRVKDGQFTAGLNVMYGSTSGNAGRMGTTSHTQPVEVKSGETTQVRLGGEGTTVKGRLTVPEGVKVSIPWHMGAVNLQTIPPSQGPTNLFQALGNALAKASEGLAASGEKTPADFTPAFNRTYAAIINSDGSFEIVDVLPGTYRVSCTIYREPEGNTYNWDPLATITRPITATVEQSPLDLGDLELTIKEAQPVRDSATGTFILRATPVQ